MSSPIREVRPEPLLDLRSLTLDTSPASVLAQEMYWEGASQGAGCLVEGYFGHDTAARAAQLAILQEYYAPDGKDPKDPALVQEASRIVLCLWGIK